MNNGFLGIALAAHELWLRDDKRGNRFSVPYGSNLSGCNLSGCDLSGCNLSGSNLSGCNLRDSNLSGSNLSGCNLRDSNLSGCNLRDSNLSGSNLSGSNLSGCNLSGCDLSGCNLRGCNLSGSSLRGSNLSGCDRIIGPLRSDGYLFTFCTESGLVIAGCQRKSIAEYIEHCNTYEDPAKGRETLAILECLKLLVAAREAQP